jgi:tRNA threonylcarbamoyladenosine biosynthesis protein TsaE
VDAYRLDSAAEIDDIDLENTMDSAVTVVEWGRGRVEHLSDSRLDVELHRAVGSVSTPSGGDGLAGSGLAGNGTLDFTEDDDEPRTIVIRGYGPRWADVPLFPEFSRDTPAEGGN